MLFKNNTPTIMGILNMTPDSFADGALYNTIDKATIRAENMLASGADIIDIGGESTRPSANSVSSDEELSRVIPIISALSKRLDIKISIDTTKASVMREAIIAGASLVNDINALREDNAIKVVASLGASVCLVHKKGTPKTMQNNPNYESVVTEVYDFLATRVEKCLQAGIKKNRIIIDPGFGFGKTYQHNITLLKNLAIFKRIGLPILVGMSRKSMLDIALGGNTKTDDRITASVVYALVAVINGASIVRVHDVKQTRDAFMVLEGLNSPN